MLQKSVQLYIKMILSEIIYDVRSSLAKRRLKTHVETLFAEGIKRTDVTNGLMKYYRMEEEFKEKFPGVEIPEIKELIGILEYECSQDKQQTV